MRKFIKVIGIFLMLFGVTLNADLIANNIAEVKRVIQIQELIAEATDLYIQKYATAPTIAILKADTLLPTDFIFTGTLAVDIATKKITLTNSIAPHEIYQVDYYLQIGNHSKIGIPTNNADDFVTSYAMSIEAVKTIDYSTQFTVQPTAPTGVNGGLWYNTFLKQPYIYYGAWRSLNIKRVWIVSTIAERDAKSASLNDCAIVLTSVSFDKYLYDGGAWQLIPQTIPFTLNGSF